MHHQAQKLGDLRLEGVGLRNGFRFGAHTVRSHGVLEVAIDIAGTRASSRVWEVLTRVSRAQPGTVPDAGALLSPRRPAPLGEPRAILRHLRALRRRRAPLAGRRLG